MKNTARVEYRYPLKRKDGSWSKVTGWLEQRAALSFEAMRNEFRRKYGRDLLVTDSGRTYAQQAALKKAKPRLAATPGKSWHEAGLAIDVAVGYEYLKLTQKQIEAFMSEFGWVRTVSTEPWHFEWHVHHPRSKGVVSAIAYIGNNKA